MNRMRYTSRHYLNYFYFSMALPAHSGPRPLIQFRNHFSETVGLLGRVISPSQGLYLNSEQHKHRINAYTQQTSMPQVGFELTIPVFERAKTVHASDRAATVTDTISTITPWLVVRKRTIPTKRPPLASEVSANFCG
jgi:hypothetical protein